MSRALAVIRSTVSGRSSVSDGSICTAFSKAARSSALLFGCICRIRSTRTAAISSHASTITKCGTTSPVIRADWAEKLACSSTPRDSVAWPSTAGIAIDRKLASEAAAVYSITIRPELPLASSAANGRRPV